MVPTVGVWTDVCKRQSLVIVTENFKNQIDNRENLPFIKKKIKKRYCRLNNTQRIIKSRSKVMTLRASLSKVNMLLPSGRDYVSFKNVCVLLSWSVSLAFQLDSNG